MSAQTSEAAALRRCFRWRGLGFPEGLDGELGTEYLVQEWGYPDIGVVIADTPSGGHDAVMLDYSECGPQGEPRVVYVDDDRSMLVLARDFSAFVAGLEDFAGFTPAGSTT